MSNIICMNNTHDWYSVQNEHRCHNCCVVVAMHNPPPTCMHVWKLDFTSFIMKCEKCGQGKSPFEFPGPPPTSPKEETPQEAYDRAMKGL